MMIHPELGGPGSRGVGPRAPPDPLSQAFRVRLKRQQTWRIREHRTRVRLSEALAAEQVEKFFRMSPAHVRVGLTFAQLVAEIAPSIDNLLRRAAADSQL